MGNARLAQNTRARTLIQKIFQFFGQALLLLGLDEFALTELADHGLRKRVGQSKRDEVDSTLGFPVRQVPSVPDSIATHGVNGRFAGFSAQGKYY